MSKPIQIGDCSKVELHIHVLGYYPKGESILVILWDSSDSSALISILIDCYQQDKINRMDALLKKYGIDTSKLDYLVWTHPDVDHSLGLSEIIKNFSSKATMILVPSGYKMQIFRSFKGCLYDSAIAVLAKARRDKDTVAPISTSGLYSNNPIIQKSYVDGFSDSLPFTMEILAPFAEHSFHVTEVLKRLNKNDISIAFNIKFGSYRFFFGGDVTNNALNKINDEWLLDTVFVKIPHHGSSTSDRLPELYDNLASTRKKRKSPKITSITTTFDEHPTHLPDNNVLNKYIGCAKKILQTKGDVQIDNYGIWSLKYRLNSRVPIESHSGDASIYYV